LDMASVRDWTCTKLKWTVERLIAEATLVFIVAETQTGKTLHGLYLAHAMLRAGLVYGKLTVNLVEKVLYLGLEDPDRRFQSRGIDTQTGFEAIEPGRFIVHTAHGFRLNDERMFGYLEQLILKHSFDVVFLDTYQRATPGITSFDDEKQSLILHRLANLTRQHGVTIIVLDHVRKNDGKRKGITMDDIKGTGGKLQNADSVILMERTPDRKQIKLQGFSKDSDKPVGFLLNVSPEGSTEPKFSYVADLEELGSESRRRGEENREKLVRAFHPGEWLDLSTVVERTGFSTATARRHINDLVKTGKLDKTGNGRWTRYAAINHSGENDK
jgi:hypothetical protein